MDNTIQLELRKLGDEVKKVVRRQDEISKQVDLLFKDREILEDMQGSIKHLQEIILQNQTHQDNTKKDLKADIKGVQFAVEDKVDEVRLGIEEKTVLVNNVTESVISKIKKKLVGG